MIDDKIDLLTISMPPGTGKSTLGIFFLSWVMGRNPHSQNLASAHSGLLTRSFFDGVLEIIQDPEYLWHDVFRGVSLASTNTKEETIDLNKKHRFSTLTCRAINASLTGATRCDTILYADDLCSGIEEAMSKERLDKLWMSYTNDLKSRKKKSAKEIHIATRWSVHDVIGRLEAEYGESPRARFIVLPAFDEEGRSNFNYAYDVGFDEAYFEDMRANLDEASFKALFMNQPIEREGLLYHADELRRYFELPPEEPDAIIGVCDTKDKGTDYAFLPVAYVYGQDYYIEDCVCDNNKPEIVDTRLENILLQHKVKSCRFESNSAGGRVAEKVQKDVKERGGVTNITTKFTSANKETKIIVNSPWVKEHCLFKDKSVYARSSEYGKMIEMLCSYTMMGRNKHDDVPDGMAMLAEYAQSLSGQKVEIFKRPF
jgi:predicted phage terminase large subunit-like protein